MSGDNDFRPLLWIWIYRSMFTERASVNGDWLNALWLCWWCWWFHIVWLTEHGVYLKRFCVYFFTGCCAISMTWNGNHRSLFKLLSRCAGADTFSMKFSSYNIMFSMLFMSTFFYWFLAIQVVIKQNTPWTKGIIFLLLCIFLLVHFICLSVWLLILISVTIEAQ